MGGGRATEGCVCDVGLIERRRKQIKGACVFGERGTRECEEGVPKVLKGGGTHCTSESVCRAA